MSDPQNLFPQSFQTTFSRQLHFPARCSRCGLRPGTKMHPVSQTSSPTSGTMSWSTEVPICEECEEEIRIARERESKPQKWLLAVLLGNIILGIFLAMVIVPPGQRARQLFAIIIFGVCLGFIIHFALIWLIGTIRKKMDKDNINFVRFDRGMPCFRNKDYQSEFDELNRDAELKIVVR